MTSLFERIKSTVQRLKPPPTYELGEEPGAPGEKPEDIIKPVKRATYIDEANIIHVIRESARKRLLISLLYQDIQRYVEPYSFRPGKHGLLLYGFCLTHNVIHSFYIHRIQEVAPTQIPFSPRWVIEL